MQIAIQEAETHKKPRPKPKPKAKTQESTGTTRLIQDSETLDQTARNQRGMDRTGPVRFAGL